MVRDIMTPKLKEQLERFWNFLEEHPDKLESFGRFTQDARLHALNQITPFMNFEEWKEVCKRFKMPFPIKKHGQWNVFASKEDEVYNIMNENLVKGGKHAVYSVKFAKQGKAPIYHMENKTIEELEISYFNDETKFFLTNGLKCWMSNCNNDANYYRKLDDNPRPTCKDHYDKLPLITKRHYFKI